MRLRARARPRAGARRRAARPRRTRRPVREPGALTGGGVRSPDGGRAGGRETGRALLAPASPPPPSSICPHRGSRLTGPHRHGVLRIVTDTCVHLWRRVHMDLVRYPGCVCRPSC
ncbi:putative leader peptide [Streptomyces sp. NPDC058418]|uniref:putative leader peptide n=1 Tax=unclassified Streptomyces TaxID=2593676 RepID=UPI003666B3A2